MTKIDESKQYKFSEIIAMIENKELLNKTVISRKNTKYDNKSLRILRNGFNELGLVDFSEKFRIQATISVNDINSLWTITLPKEDKFYLKAPKMFYHRYLNFDRTDKTYSLSDEEDSSYYKTQFTQKEIDAMPFDTNFFGDPTPVEQADE